MKFYYISWEKQHEMCFELAQRITDVESRSSDMAGRRGAFLQTKFDYIVAISRGGLVVARILSDFLNLPIYNIVIESYEEMGKHKTPIITQDLGSAGIVGKRILLVDEISDSGKTFELAMKYLKNFNSQIRSACLILKSRSSFTPDFYCEKIDKWVIFPYEVRETIDALRDKMNKDEIIKLGVPREFVMKM